MSTRQLLLAVLALLLALAPLVTADATSAGLVLALVLLAVAVLVSAGARWTARIGRRLATTLQVRAPAPDHPSQPTTHPRRPRGPGIG